MQEVYGKKYEAMSIEQLKQEIEKAGILIALKMGCGRELHEMEYALLLARRKQSTPSN